MHLQLQNSLIRDWRSSDVDSLARYANNKKIWLNLRDRFPHPYTPRAAEEWIALNRANPGCNFAIEVDSEAVGAIGVVPENDVHAYNAEMGYWLGEPYWGRGIVSEAVAALTRWVCQEKGVRRVYAPVYGWNPGSVRVLEKCGYELEGRLRNRVFKNGEFTDELVYAWCADSP